MEIEIEICGLRPDELGKRNRLNALVVELQELAGKTENVMPNHENKWTLTGEDALPLLARALDRAERGQLSYKVRFHGLESDEVVCWSRVFAK